MMNRPGDEPSVMNRPGDEPSVVMNRPVMNRPGDEPSWEETSAYQIIKKHRNEHYDRNSSVQKL